MVSRRFDGKLRNPQSIAAEYRLYRHRAQSNYMFAFCVHHLWLRRLAVHDMIVGGGREESETVEHAVGLCVTQKGDVAVISSPYLVRSIDISA